MTPAAWPSIARRGVDAPAQHRVYRPATASNKAMDSAGRFSVPMGHVNAGVSIATQADRKVIRKREASI